MGSSFPEHRKIRPLQNSYPSLEWLLPLAMNNAASTTNSYSSLNVIFMSLDSVKTLDPRLTFEPATKIFIGGLPVIPSATMSGKTLWRAMFIAVMLAREPPGVKIPSACKIISSKQLVCNDSEI